MTSYNNRFTFAHLGLYPIKIIKNQTLQDRISSLAITKTRATRSF